MSVKSFVSGVVVEGGRVFWTAVEALAGVAAAYAVPDSLFDAAGQYEPAVVAAVVVGVASVATVLKEAARKHLSP